MKSRWHKSLRIFLLLLAFSVWGGMPLCAQQYERMSEVEQVQYGINAHVPADYDEMTAIKRFWYKESLKQKSRRYSFVLTGSNDCVLKVTMEAGELFNENDSIINKAADGVLRPFLKYLRGGDAQAHVIVAVHSDNNGSDKYLNSMTAGRARNIAAWMVQQGVPAASIMSYGWGKRVPLNDNGNLEKRRRNRRVSLYLIPNKTMIRQAKKGKLEETPTVTVKK